MQYKEIKKIGVLLRPSTPEIKETFFQLKKIFESHKIEVLLDSVSGGMIQEMGMDFDLLCSSCDTLVTLGGDGTLISAVRRSFEYDIPVLGVHAGNLGFLADIGMDELDSFVQDLKNGLYRLDERSILEVLVEREEGDLRLFAFNDLVLTRSSISNMIHIETLVDSKAFNTYHGDGVIVSTPTGSTAYNLSAGGPVLFPLTNVFALTPICPHSLTQRPVVLPGTFSIEMKTPKNRAIIIVDGQDMYEIAQNQSIKINLARKPARLIHRVAFNYFDVLKEKLNWGD